MKRINKILERIKQWILSIVIYKRFSHSIFVRNNISYGVKVKEIKLWDKEKSKGKRLIIDMRYRRYILYCYYT